MIRMVIAIVSFMPLLYAKQDSQSEPRPFVSLHEAAMEVGPNGLWANACIAIQADGHFRIERRWQQLPSSTTNLHIYQGSLNNFQLQRLISLLNSQNIKDLGSYAPPPIPTELRVFSSFDAEIRREDNVQKPGYFSWDERQNKFDQSISAAQREQWHTAQTVLLPVVQWFHEIEGMKWLEVPAAENSTFCKIDPQG